MLSQTFFLRVVSYALKFNYKSEIAYEICQYVSKLLTCHENISYAIDMLYAIIWAANSASKCIRNNP